MPNTDNMNMRYLLTIIFLILTFPSSSNSTTIGRSLDDDVVDFRTMSRAAADGDIESVEILLRRGIPPNGISPNGIDVHGDYEQEDILNSKLLYYTSTYVRPLQAAAENGHIEIVKLLLQHGADPNWCCCECVTALHMAIENRHEDVANLLIENGANVDLPYTTKEKKFFKSCLEFAKSQGLLNTVKLIENK